MFILQPTDGDSALNVPLQTKNFEIKADSSESTEPCEFVENAWSEDQWKKHNFDVLIDDPGFTYIDFAKRCHPSDSSTYRIQDYQWDDQGYSLSNYLYPDIAPYLDEKFKVGYNLTYYT